jgi:hypothetical protein
MWITAIERRQDALDEKLSEVLARTKAQTAAIDELKAMFVKCAGRFRETEDGSPLVLKSALENQVSQPSPLVQSADLGNDDVHDEMADEVDVQDSSPPRTATDVEKATPGSERTSEEGEKVEKADAEVAIAPAKPRKEDSIVAAAAGKATVTPSPSPSPSTWCHRRDPHAPVLELLDRQELPSVHVHCVSGSHMVNCTSQGVLLVH